MPDPTIRRTNEQLSGNRPIRLSDSRVAAVVKAAYLLELRRR